MKPADVVQRQLDAYNERHLERFGAQYSADITTFRLPGAEPVLVGKEAFLAFFAAERFSRPGLHAELVNRIVLGNKVIDHERIAGVRAQPFEVAVAYEVVDGLIRRPWTLAPE